WPELALAHPLDGGDGAAMLRSVQETAVGLGPGGEAWERLFDAPARRFDALSEDILRPVLHLPSHPILLTRFGGPALAPATALARTLQTPRARALFGGVAAHSFAPLGRPLSSAVGMALICAGHRHGWPVARGGSRAITEALAAAVLEHGGRIETGREVRSL